jgi:ribosomal protein L7/L12
LVEKVPVIISKDLKKEDAEALTAKLVAVGCNVKLI